MKRSKVFLSVTTCLLAIAAVAAGKARFNGTTVSAGCYTVSGSGVSVSKSCVTEGTDRLSNKHTRCFTSGGVKALYTCVEYTAPLYKTQGE